MTKEVLTKQQAVSPFLTLAEAAQFLKFSQSWVKKQVREKKISRFRFGRQVRFHVADLERFALEHRENVGTLRLLSAEGGRWHYTDVIEKTNGDSR